MHRKLENVWEDGIGVTLNCSSVNHKWAKIVLTVMFFKLSWTTILTVHARKKNLTYYIMIIICNLFYDKFDQTKKLISIYKL